MNRAVSQRIISNIYEDAGSVLYLPRQHVSNSPSDCSSSVVFVALILRVAEPRTPTLSITEANEGYPKALLEV